MNSNLQMIKKLQNAINKNFNGRLLYNQTQWFSDDKNVPVNRYILRKSVPDPETGRNNNVELFSTYSQLQMVFYLRDMWYELNGWEVPTDNEQWNEAKERYIKEHGECRKRNI